MQRLTICITAFIAVTSFGTVARSEQPSAIESLREMGYPINMEQLADWFPAPSQEKNAAKVFAPAFEVIEPFRDDILEDRIDVGSIPVLNVFQLELLERRMSPEVLADARKILNQYSRATDSLKRGAKVEGLLFPLDREDLSFPRHEYGLIAWTRGLIEFAGIVAAESNNVDEAMELIGVTLALDKALVDPGDWYESLPKYQMKRLTARQIQNLTSRCTLTDSQYQQLIVILSRLHADLSRDRLVISRLCRFLDAVPQDDMNQREYCATVAAALIAHDGPWIRGYHQTESMLAKIDKRMKVAIDFVNELNRLHVVQARADTRRLATIVALAVFQYEAARKRKVTALDELVPQHLAAVPKDPYDPDVKRTLRFKRTEKGFLIYATGRDGKDNGGVEYNEDGKSFEPGADVVIHFHDLRN